MCVGLTFRKAGIRKVSTGGSARGSIHGGSIYRYKFLLIAAIAAAPAAPAFAQSGPGSDFAREGFDDRTGEGVSGFRIEPRIGYDRIVTELNVETATDSAGVREGKSGVTYGGEAGYDVVVNVGTMLGVYGGIEGSRDRASNNASPATARGPAFRGDAT